MPYFKPRVIKDFAKLPPKTKKLIKLAYPYGFHDSLIHFYNKGGHKVSALPFETDEKYYMVRMTVVQAIAIIEEDDDFDDNSTLKIEIKGDYKSKYSDVDYMNDYISEGAKEDD